jgi:hypothetical protein
MNITNYIGQISLKYFIENFNNIVLPYQLWKFINPDTQKYTYLYLGEKPKRKGHYIKSAMFTDLENRDIEEIVRIIDFNTKGSGVYIPDSWLNSDNLVYLVESDFRKNENSILRFLNVLKHDNWRNESDEDLE